MPFYKALSNLNKFTIQYILSEAEKSCHENYKNVLNSFDIVVSFKKVNSLKQSCT